MFTHSPTVSHQRHTQEKRGDFVTSRESKMFLKRTKRRWLSQKSIIEKEEKPKEAVFSISERSLTALA